MASTKSESKNEGDSHQYTPDLPAALFICDLQTGFRNAIHGYDKVVATTSKLIRACKILNIPVLATTQSRAKLGVTDPALNLDVNGGITTLAHADKTRFSMFLPSIRDVLCKSVMPHYGITENGRSAKLQIVIVGIESHICVAQTALDMMEAGHEVYVLADAVSSCNREETPIALARLAAKGATVTTSESWIFERLRDAERKEFRDIVALVKETKQATKDALGELCKV